MISNEAFEQTVKAMREYGECRYHAGLRAGLIVAEKAAGYLAIQPPRKWAEQIRKWIEADIQKAKEQHGL